ncbi:MAG: 3-isopropylmalate dehydratase large subunit [Deltaproteobacteria bacterium]|nr:3-isopropylmalate dehydratase large subunit [Deltaproteobacteria bacterium]
MAKGYTGEIIEGHANGRSEGEYLSVEVDFVLLHDPTFALILPELKKSGEEIWDREKVLLTVDHFSPPSSIERANIVKEVLSFAREKRLPHLSVYQGICHQLLVEGPWLKPGMLVLGADSHTVTGGALGCLATGMGSTDILYALITGRTWLKPPEAVRIDLREKLPPYLMGKDVILDLLGRYGEGGFLYQALEFYDKDEAIPMDDRFAICNMVVEGGAKNGLFRPDRVTENYLMERDGHLEKSKDWLEEGFKYSRKIEMDLSSLKPKIALPHSPAQVIDAEEIKDEAIDQVFIGSCTGGRLRDIELTAKLLRGRKVARGVRLLVTPASQRIYKMAIEKGYISAIIEAGGVVLNPSCGPCGGIDKGILGREERCLSASNRNFKGRMGDPSSKVFLSSPLTAAASALAGRIIDPREVM